MRFCTLLAFLLAFIISGCSDRVPGRVLIVTFDALRADHLGCYGYRRFTSPHIDAFASESILFRYPTAQAPWTDGSLASLHTGRFTYEVYYGSTGKSHPINPDVKTLAQSLHEAGMYNVAIVANARLFAGLGLDRGFDEYHELFLDTYGISANPKNPENMERPDADRKRIKSKVTATRMTDEALAALNVIGNDEFFMWLHYLEPHTPYIRYPDSYYSPAFPLDSNVVEGEIIPLDFMHEIHQAYLTGKGSYPPHIKQKINDVVTLYDAEIRYLDDQFGRLIQGLKSRGIYEDTLIIVTADHGESLFDHEGYFGHGQYPYQTTVRVPLIIRWPEGWKGIVDPQVGLVDIVPTVLEYFRIPLDKNLRGRILTPHGRQNEDAPIVTETIYERSIALQEGPYKLIEWAPSKKRSPSLFNVVDDPSETEDLSAVEPEKASRMRIKLNQTFSQLIPAPDTTFQDGLTEDVTEKIRSLGYAW